MRTELPRPRAGEERPCQTYVRHVSSRLRSVVIPRHPGGGRAMARVSALNSEGRPGPAGKHSFATNPSARTLRDATRASIRSLVRRGGWAVLRTSCPKGGHCQVRVRLLLDGRQVASTAHQQTPDTFHLIRLYRATARSGGHPAADGKLRAVVVLRRSSSRSVAGLTLGD